MFETGKNVHQNSNYLEYHSSEMLLWSLTYNTFNQMSMKRKKIISKRYKIVMEIQKNRKVALNPGMEFSTLIAFKLFITLVGSVYTMSGLVSKLCLGRYEAVLAGRRLSALFGVVSFSRQTSCSAGTSSFSKKQAICCVSAAD